MIWFKELYELWRQDNSLTQAVNDSHKMLEQTLVMFKSSVQSLRHTDSGELELNVYDADSVVNEYIQKVRHKVLKHMAITGGLNIIPGLILTTIVIDIERIGDYTKNIMDLALAHPKKLNAGSHEADLQRIENTVTQVFEKLVQVLDLTNKQQMGEMIKENYWVLKKCDSILIDYIKRENSDGEVRDAASCALYARYLKRVMGHLMNIASSVVNPFERIGFRAEE
ncbi:MAG: hypothetical protein H6695_14895 [Deferribacteres bacterium]|nr:hypothetical protein [candidate division KSB1 bacterium]MCB9511473.1 hypothetical protein [Deferribacteres bacterium]